MDKFICIDLSRNNNDQLMIISKNVGVDYNCLIENKKNGFSKIWIDRDLNTIVSFILKGKDAEMSFTSDYLDKMKQLLLSKEPVKITKQPVSYNVNSILEKITKYGIESLDKKEKDFLDAQ